MTEENRPLKTPHVIVLQERKDLSVSGVLDVRSFDESLVVMETTLGELAIHGNHLHISKTNIETGELVLDGEIFDLVYSVKRTAKKSGRFRFFSTEE